MLLYSSPTCLYNRLIHYQDNDQYGPHYRGYQVFLSYFSTTFGYKCSHRFPNIVLSTSCFLFQGYGYNSGVVLMDLAKLRSAAWNHLWMSAIKFVMKATRYLSAGEQGVINLIMFRNNETFYKIPCEWNIQLSSGVDVHRCPVSWLAEKSLLNNRDLMHGKQPKIVYLNHQVKPEYLDLENILNVDTNVTLTNYN
ncbi:uncharacterized protein DC041_0005982, partial [Schistosoma bovis]